MLYAAFTIWLFLILFAGIGIYKLWSSMTKPAYVQWALLPGTLVSEMAYILGSLLTGGEIRRAKLLDAPGGKGKGGDGGGGGGSASSTQASGGIRFVGPVVASGLAIVACATAILLAARWLGADIVEAFTSFRGGRAGLERELPLSWDGFWNLLVAQVHLLRRLCETIFDGRWFSWRGLLFVYLAMCLSIRLSPVGRPLRPTLASVVVMAALIALAGLAWDSMGGLIGDLWPLITYVWASLLLLLALSLLIRGIAALAKAMGGKG